MVDRYIFGKVERISPEAPVPVNKVDHMTSVLGGAANVASNLANLDCHVLLGGLIGDDENADLLHDLLTESHIDGSGLVVRKDHATTTKMRILGSRQQMVRLDFEEVTPLAEKEEEILLNWLHQQLATSLDGIILSDYQKAFSPIPCLKKSSKPLITRISQSWSIPRAAIGANITVPTS